MDIKKLINSSVEDKDSHYLYQGCNKDDEYYKSFIDCMQPLIQSVPEKKILDLLTNKLQLKKGKFTEKQYIQSACETTVVSFFAKKYPQMFVYEKIVNSKSKKNVECQFVIESFLYNIEVKCPDFGEKEKNNDTENLRIETVGRIPDNVKVTQEIEELVLKGQIAQGNNPKKVKLNKNMDNTLKDFLISAHEKFNPKVCDNEVNILVVCGSDQQDMQSWFNYFSASKGLFTKDSFVKHEKYSLVDLVLLTNLYHRHNKYYEKEHLKNNWDLEKAFILPFCNPYRLSEKEKSIKNLLDKIPHYGNDLSNYKPFNEVPLEVRNSVLITSFIKEELTDKGIDLF